MALFIKEVNLLKKAQFKNFLAWIFLSLVLIANIFFHYGIWFANIMWQESFGEFPEVTAMYKVQQLLLLAVQELGVLSFVNLVTLVFVSIFKDATLKKFSLIKVYLLFELATSSFLIATVFLFIF